MLCATDTAMDWMVSMVMQSTMYGKISADSIRLSTHTMTTSLHTTPMQESNEQSFQVDGEF